MAIQDPPPVTASAPVIVIGGGLAGLAAAEALLGQGRRVVLLEQRGTLGGRAGGFRENGQHVWMPCCTELVGFLGRTGADGLTTTQSRLRVAYLQRDAEPAVLQALPLPSPFHFLGPLMRFPLLDRRDAGKLIGTLIRLRLLGRKVVDEGVDDLLMPWLLRHGQTERAIEVFWRPAITSILNVPLEEARLDLGAMAVRISFLAGSRKANLAWTSVPHVLVWDRIAEHLAESGAEVRTGVRVEGLEVSGSRVVGVRTRSEGLLDASAVVAAVPPRGLESLLPLELRRRTAFAAGRGLAWSAILNLHVWFAERVTDEQVLCLTESPLHWIFAKPSQEPESGRRPVPSSAQHLNLVVSASDGLAELDPRTVKDLLLSELMAHLPAAAGAEVLATRLVHERRATFRAVPGSEDDRPGPQTPVRGLVVAGAWTATGWPSTLEGAVRSGRAAAKALIVKGD